MWRISWLVFIIWSFDGFLTKKNFEKKNEKKDENPHQYLIFISNSIQRIFMVLVFVIVVRIRKGWLFFLFRKILKKLKNSFRSYFRQISLWWLSSRPPTTKFASSVRNKHFRKLFLWLENLFTRVTFWFFINKSWERPPRGV